MARKAANAMAKKAGRRPKRRSPSKAYEHYETLAERSLNLGALQPAVRAFLAATKTPETDVDPDDLVRASVVLAVAAMDAYFTDIFAEMLVPYLKKRGPTPAMIDLLSRAGLDTKVALEMLGLDRPYRRVRTLVEAHFERYTTQKMHIIDNLFLCFRVKNLTANAEKRTRKTTLRSKIEKLVLRRNAIVHDGDRDAFGRSRAIGRQAMRNRIRNSMEFVSSVDFILSRIL